VESTFPEPVTFGSGPLQPMSNDELAKKRLFTAAPMMLLPATVAAAQPIPLRLS
jgi:hypothetical protein